MNTLEFIFELLSKFWLFWIGIGVLAAVGAADYHYTQRQKRHRKIMDSRKKSKERAKSNW